MINRSTIKMALTAKADCLSLDELERLAEDPSPTHPHLSTCPRCQAELAMLKEFETSSPLPDEGAAVTWISSEMERRLDQIKKGGVVANRKQSTGWSGWLSGLLGSGSARWLVPVAAIALIAVASTMMLRSSKQPQLIADSGNGAAIYRSQQVDIVAPIGDLPDPPKELQWKAFAGATKYRVEVMEVDHVMVWSGESNYITVTIPAATRAKMLPGKPVLWRVTALDNHGQTLAASQIQRFSVRRKTSSLDSGFLPQ